MNKGGVEMETQSHKELDSVKAPEDSTQPPELDASIEPHEVENGNAQLSVDSAVVGDESKAKLEQGREHSQPRKDEEEMEVEMESGDQIKVDQTHPTEEEINGNGNAEQQDEANGAAEQQDSGRIGANVDAELQNKAKGEGLQECPPAAENETQPSVEEQGSYEHGKQINDAVDTMMEVKPASEIAVDEIVHSHIGELPFQLPVSEVPPKKKEALDEVHTSGSGEIAKGLAQVVNHSETEDLVKMELDNKSVLPTATRVSKPEAGVSPFVNKPSPATPDMSLKYSGRRSAGYSGSGEAIKNVYNDFKMAENDDGTPEQQAAFIKEIENFYRQRGVEFKTPKFYGHPLNCYKLWTSVIKLGGYDLVTGTKLWRQVGESFHPPKTCTTVSWTFRIFYEKSLLEYERYKVQNGEVELPAVTPPEPSSADIEGNGHLASGSGRARRDAAARAMQGWHAQRLYGIGEDKSPNSMQKRENKIKSIGSLKQKRPNEGELQPSVKTPRTDSPKQLVTTVIDVGPPADWVKINVRETKDCFEVYALVPGLLREEVRVQSDPAGRLVITGQPEQTENPWGITSFRKVVSLPGRIDPLQTSAVVSLHGRLFVRVPFEQSTNQ